jgi:hypothetical protein
VEVARPAPIDFKFLIDLISIQGFHMVHSWYLYGDSIDGGPYFAYDFIFRRRSECRRQQLREQLYYVFNSTMVTNVVFS